MKRPVNRGRHAIPAMLPAPVGGLNGRDTFAAMPSTDAFVLDNFFPFNTSVDTRGGSLNFVTGIPAPVESLAVYTGGAGSKMFAFAGANVYDASVAGAVGASVKAGRVSARVTTCMFSNAGAQFLLVYSGADQPYAYNGAAWSDLTITGMTGSQTTLHSPHAFKGRVFLCQAAQLGFYYLAVGAIQAAASYFDLSQVSLKGGYLVSITSFSQGETGQGPDDFALFITSEGEYILYKGTDPSSAATWALVGRYYAAPPIGRKGWFKFRADVYFITREGIMSFAQIRQSGEGNKTDEYLTAKLGRNYTDVTTYTSAFGWCGIVYPHGKMLLVNVPFAGTLSGEFVQFAMNTDTSAFGRFRELPAIDWVIFNEAAYFSTYTGNVVQYDSGVTDNGMQIKSTGRQAWNTFESDKVGEMDKQFHMAQLVLKSSEIPTVACSVNVDFEDESPLAVVPNPVVSGGVWDVAAWDVSFWGGSDFVQNVDISVGKIGYVASMWVEVVSLSARVQWIASRLLIQPTQRGFI